MSTFAVWGMTYAYAFGIAQKKTSMIDAKGQTLPEEDWMNRVKAVTESIMEGEMVRQLSSKFDAPQFAHEFMAIAKRMQRHRDLEIRCWTQAKDAEGKPIYQKNGKRPKMTWAPYSEEGQ